MRIIRGVSARVMPVAIALSYPIQYLPLPCPALPYPSEYRPYPYPVPTLVGPPLPISELKLFRSSLGTSNRTSSIRTYSRVQVQVQVPQSHALRTRKDKALISLGKLQSTVLVLALAGTSDRATTTSTYLLTS